MSPRAAPYARDVAEMGARAASDLALENARAGWLHVRDLAIRAGWPAESPGMPEWAPRPSPGGPFEALRGRVAAQRP